GVASRRAEQAILSRSVSSVQRTRYSEGSKVKEIARVARIVKGRNNVGASEEFPTAVVIILEVVIQMEWLTGLNGHNPVHSPAVGEFFHTGGVWELVDKIPGQAIAHIEIGIAAVKTKRGRAVIWLRDVGYVIFAVTSIVDGMRPGVVERR